MIDCKKFAAVGAVFVMMAVAFAGITFLSEEADAATLEKDSNGYYTKIEGTATTLDKNTTFNVAIGCTVSITNCGPIPSITGGKSMGLTLDGTTLTGTVTSVGKCTLELRINSGTVINTITILAFESSSETNHNHTITYSGNGNTSGSTVNTVVTTSGTNATNITLASNGFTKTGYTFTGWLINGTTYQPGATISVAADATVTATAQWSENKVTASASTLYGKTNASYSNQITASATNGASISYAVKSVTGGSATVNSSGLVTYKCPTVTATTTYGVTVTVTGTFSDGSTVSKDVVFDVIVDPILAFTNAVTSGTLSVKGTGA